MVKGKSKISSLYIPQIGAAVDNDAIFINSNYGDELTTREEESSPIRRIDRLKRLKSNSSPSGFSVQTDLKATSSIMM